MLLYCDGCRYVWVIWSFFFGVLLLWAKLGVGSGMAWALAGLWLFGLWGLCRVVEACTVEVCCPLALLGRFCFRRLGDLHMTEPMMYD